LTHKALFPGGTDALFFTILPHPFSRGRAAGDRPPTLAWGGGVRWYPCQRSRPPSGCSVSLQWRPVEALPLIHINVRLASVPYYGGGPLRRMAVWRCRSSTCPGCHAPHVGCRVGFPVQRCRLGPAVCLPCWRCSALPAMGREAEQVCCGLFRLDRTLPDPPLFSHSPPFINMYVCRQSSLPDRCHRMLSLTGPANAGDRVQ
jgi:hypothetical protein